MFERCKLCEFCSPLSIPALAGYLSMHYQLTCVAHSVEKPHNAGHCHGKSILVSASTVMMASPHAHNLTAQLAIVIHLQ